MIAFVTLEWTQFQTACCAAAGAALAAALALTPVLGRLALRWGVVDHSDGDRKLHGQQMPLLGGVALLLSIVTGTALATIALGHSPLVLPLTVAGVIICIVGIVDDVWTLQPRWKLFGQIVATWPLLMSGWMVERVAIGGFEFGLGWWAAPFTVTWLIAGINAFNFTDGVDGLASLLGLVAVAAISVAAVLTGNTVVLPLLLPVGGALCGFLVYNLPPAKIFLGDAGSMLIGLFIAASATQVVRTDGGVALVPLLLLTAVPLVDMSLAVIRRTQTGVYFWRADRLHIHHRLLQRGWNPRMVLAFLGVLSGVFAVLGVEALVAEHEGWACAAAFALVLVAIQARFFGHYEWSLVKRKCALAALNATANWWSQRTGAQLPSADELTELTDEAVWECFRGEMDKLAAARVDITTGTGGRIRWRHHWSSAAAANLVSDQFALQIRSETADGGWCVARAQLNPAERMHPSALLSLTATLKHFSQVWATRPGAACDDPAHSAATFKPKRAAA